MQKEFCFDRPTWLTVLNSMRRSLPIDALISGKGILGCHSPF